MDIRRSGHSGELRHDLGQSEIFPETLGAYISGVNRRSTRSAPAREYTTFLKIMPESIGDLSGVRDTRLRRPLRIYTQGAAESPGVVGVRVR